MIVLVVCYGSKGCNWCDESVDRIAILGSLRCLIPGIEHLLLIGRSFILQFPQFVDVCHRRKVETQDIPEIGNERFS